MDGKNLSVGCRPQGLAAGIERSLQALQLLAAWVAFEGLQMDWIPAVGSGLARSENTSKFVHLMCAVAECVDAAVGTDSSGAESASRFQATPISQNPTSPAPAYALACGLKTAQDHNESIAPAYL